MTSEELARIIGDVDEKYILEAVPKKRVPAWKVVLPMAATVTLLLAAGTIYSVTHFGAKSSETADYMAVANGFSAAETTAAAMKDAEIVEETMCEMAEGDAVAGEEMAPADLGDMDGAVENIAEEVSGTYTVMDYSAYTSDGIRECTFRFTGLTDEELLTIELEDPEMLYCVSFSSMELLEETDDVLKFRFERSDEADETVPELTLSIGKTASYHVRGVFDDGSSGDFDIDVMSE